MWHVNIKHGFAILFVMMATATMFINRSCYNWSHAQHGFRASKLPLAMRRIAKRGIRLLGITVPDFRLYFNHDRDEYCRTHWSFENRYRVAGFMYMAISIFTVPGKYNLDPRGSTWSTLRMHPPKLSSNWIYAVTGMHPGTPFLRLRLCSHAYRWPPRPASQAFDSVSRCGCDSSCLNRCNSTTIISRSSVEVSQFNETCSDMGNGIE